MGGVFLALGYEGLFEEFWLVSSSWVSITFVGMRLSVNWRVVFFAEGRSLLEEDSILRHTLPLAI